jgi:hypothetical protein
MTPTGAEVLSMAPIAQISLSDPFCSWSPLCVSLAMTNDYKWETSVKKQQFSKL